MPPETPLPTVLLSLDTANYAGTEAHVLALLCSLDRTRYAPALLCRFGTILHTRAAAAGVACHPAGGPASLAALLRRGRFALVHAHDGSAKLGAVLAVRLAGIPAQIVATQHFVAPAYTLRPGIKGKIARAVHRFVNRRIAAQIAVSQAVADAALTRGEVTEAQTVIIPNGILIPEPIAAETAAARRAELRLPPKTPLIAAAARLAPEKGITYLLQALAALPPALTPPHLALLGEGDLRETLQAEAVRLGVSNRVHFLGFRTEVLEWVGAADLFVLPSLAEPFGIALVEAMALGKPAVAVRAGGPCEIVSDGVTGLLVPPADPAALAAAIQSLLERPADAAAMGEAGQVRANALYSAAAMARRTEDVYTRCLSGR